MYYACFRSSGPAFIELPSPIVAKRGVFEFDNGAGATMRVQLVGYDTADVEALARRPVMLQITPHMKILVAVEPADFRQGIDALARLCQESLGQDPFAGAVFAFRNRRATALKVLVTTARGSGSATSGSRRATSPGGLPLRSRALGGWPPTNCRSCSRRTTRRARVRLPTGARSGR
jgi:hypothetical protein